MLGKKLLNLKGSKLDKFYVKIRLVFTDLGYRFIVIFFSYRVDILIFNIVQHYMNVWLKILSKIIEQSPLI